MTTQPPARTLPWYAFGLANLAVVVVLGLATWYLLADPLWSATGVYPQPLTAWMFWTIIAFVWVAFTFELTGFTRLRRPWRGLAVAIATFALYYWVLGGAVFHEPAAAQGTTVNGSALVGVDWLIIIALWYVAAGESWGLPRPRAATVGDAPAVVAEPAVAGAEA